MDEVIAGNAVSVTVNVRNTANRKSHVSFLIGGSSAAPSVPSDASVVAFEEDDIVEAPMSRAFDLSSSTLNSKSFSDNALFDSFFLLLLLLLLLVLLEYRDWSVLLRANVPTINTIVAHI